MTEAIVQLDSVRKSYTQGDAEIHAVDGVSLEVRPGEFTALVGPSGSGKTTLLNLVGALDVPDEGHISVEGTRLDEMGRSQLAAMRRDRIGFVFQAYNLIPVLTAFENTEFVLELQGTDAPERKKRAMEVLEAVGLKGMEHRRPDEISGGQQQRVAVARAIAPRPAIVLADEPTANLDSHSAESLLDLMEALNRDEGATFLFSTHDERVMKRARRIVRLTDGKIVSDERREDGAPS